MHQFFQRFGHQVIGHLSGFDRMMFRGSMQRLCHPAGVLLYLYWLKVLLKDFGTYAQDTTTTLCTAIERQAVERDTPMIYVGATTRDCSRAWRTVSACTTTTITWMRSSA